MSPPLISAKQVIKALLISVLSLMPITYANAICTVSSAGLSFGGYDVFEQTHTDFTGAIEVSCDSAASYTLKLSSGYGSITDRFMLFNSHQLHYNLFVDVSRTMIWGDGVSGDSTQSGTTSSNQIHNVYGRIPARQNVTIGDYNDAVIVTLEY